MLFKLPKLDYSLDALEPYIDKKTMEVHYLKHHQGYIDKLNLIINKDASLEGVSLTEMLTKERGAVANFAGGHVNHSFFWQIMTPEKTAPGEMALKLISDKWQTINTFTEDFVKKALGVFGSGWAWLVLLNNQADIVTTANQDSPIALGQVPVLGIDVWEHAYYLKYENRREEYIRSWWNIINWRTVEENILRAEWVPP